MSTLIEQQIHRGKHPSARNLCVEWGSSFEKNVSVVMSVRMEGPPR